MANHQSDATGTSQSLFLIVGENLKPEDSDHKPLGMLWKELAKEGLRVQGPMTMIRIGRIRVNLSRVSLVMLYCLSTMLRPVLQLGMRHLQLPTTKEIILLQEEWQTKTPISLADSLQCELT
jgi:hypothetical protein